MRGNLDILCLDKRTQFGFDRTCSLCGFGTPRATVLSNEAYLLLHDIQELRELLRLGGIGPNNLKVKVITNVARILWYARRFGRTRHQLVEQTLQQSFVYRSCFLLLSFAGMCYGCYGLDNLFVTNCFQMSKRRHYLRLQIIVIPLLDVSM